MIYYHKRNNDLEKGLSPICAHDLSFLADLETLQTCRPDRLNLYIYFHLRPKYDIIGLWACKLSQIRATHLKLIPSNSKQIDKCHMCHTLKGQMSHLFISHKNKVYWLNELNEWMNDTFEWRAPALGHGNDWNDWNCSLKWSMATIYQGPWQLPWLIECSSSY